MTDFSQCVIRVADQIVSADFEADLHKEQSGAFVGRLSHTLRSGIREEQTATGAQRFPIKNGMV